LGRKLKIAEGVIELNPRVKEVKPLPDYKLLLTFDNSEVKVYDLSQSLRNGVFKELEDINLFNSVKATHGTVQWMHGQDICPDTLYLDSVEYAGEG
jgi:hypothetical protein